MGYYEDAYLARLNRYGNNYQERVLSQRRESFRRRLQKSVYRIDLPLSDSNGNPIPATFERYKQNHTKIFRYLLTEYDVTIPGGTIMMLPDPIGLLRDGEITYPEYSGSAPLVEDVEDNRRPWMVFYLEDTGAKGYNRYVMLKMTHFLEWKDRSGADRSSYAYMYGQEDNMLKDEIRSRSRMDTIYGENLKMSFFVMPANEYIRKDDYFIIDKDKNNKCLTEYYIVTGYDIQSQDGVEYVTIDPVYEYAQDYGENFYKEELSGTDEEMPTGGQFWLMNRVKEGED